ncbi:MAG: TIGR03790 family protein [Kiritimatiellales bacterium]|nr:TIGR03790 family protein [Kiritimatiellales bacterium]
MPHQVAVLVNDCSQDSKKAANVFAGFHGVPDCNRIYLNLPESMFSGQFECTPEEFKSLIYEPALKTLKERGVDGQITAWVYSVDFPIRIVTAAYDRQQMSILGLTFLRGEVPDLEQMEQGKIISPLFAGPTSEGGQKLPPRDFDVWKRGLKEKMPLPSMMLGYVGEKGNSMETVLRCIQDGVRARRNPRGPRVLFVKTDDAARSAPREWQFADVQAELKARGGSAVITTNTAPRQTGLIGVMTGSANVKPADYGSFLPGAMAEHLTSWSAEFQKPQGKCTRWLDAGATVTAGMVVEPYNNWVKFPHARFYAHYAAGCTAMESFYQAIASPVQVLLLGDPLSQIAALPVQIKPVGLSKQITSDLDAAFVIDAELPIPVAPVYSALLDGKTIKTRERNALIELPFDELDDGYHEVRLIVQAALPVAPGGFVDVPIFVNKKGRSLEITGMADRDPQEIIIIAEVNGEESPKEVYLIWNGRELVRAAAGAELVFDERTIGEGPHRIQAVAVYEDGMEVRSAPRTFAVAFTARAE